MWEINWTSLHFPEQLCKAHEEEEEKVLTEVNTHFYTKIKSILNLFKRKLVASAMWNLSHNNAVLEQAKGYKKYQWDSVLY